MSANCILGIFVHRASSVIQGGEPTFAVVGTNGCNTQEFAFAKCQDRPKPTRGYKLKCRDAAWQSRHYYVAAALLRHLGLLSETLRSLAQITVMTALQSMLARSLFSGRPAMHFQTMAIVGVLYS